MSLLTSLFSNSKTTSISLQSFGNCKIWKCQGVEKYKLDFANIGIFNEMDNLYISRLEFKFKVLFSIFENS